MTGKLALAVAALMAASSLSFAQDRREPSEAMLRAGAAAVGQAAPAAVARDVAAKVYAAMAAAAWQPIETAPQDGTDMFLGLQRNGEFMRGIGRWQVYDEPDMPGFWSVTDWFGA